MAVLVPIYPAILIWDGVPWLAEPRCRQVSVFAINRFFWGVYSESAWLCMRWPQLAGCIKKGH